MRLLIRWHHDNMEDNMTTHAQDLRSTARVTTDRSERWIKQLGDHLGRKAEVAETETGGRLLLLGGGSCRLEGDASSLHFTATAPDEESLARVEQVVGSHLQQFAAKEGLTVTWRREPPAVKSITLSPALHAYVLAHSEPLDEVQRDLVVQTQLLGPEARMQTALEAVPLLTLLVRLVGAERAVEVGTFTGLSALALAKGLPDHGRLVCFDTSTEWTQIAQQAWQRAGLADRIELRLGDARQTLSTLQGEPPVDLAYVDADKDGYPDYLELLLPHLRPGGLLVFDNTLSRGQVLDPEPGSAAAAIRDFNARLADDARLEQVLLPVGDGLTLARKV
jgi:caffeoyl-CoA O-methyltransferase